MQISAVNSNIFSQQNKSFKGLWEQTTKSSIDDEGMGILVEKITSYYHPFCDESENDILNVIAANDIAYIDDKNDKEPVYKIFECKRCSTLPFKEASYNNTYLAYDDTKRITKKIKLVHRIAENLYKNNKYGKQQISAANEEVSKHLDENI